MTTQTVTDEPVVAKQRQFVSAMSHTVNWMDNGRLARVDVTLDMPNRRFVSFPRSDYAPATTLDPNKLLAGCMLFPPMGFAVIHPSTMVILYAQEGNRERHLSDKLADAGRRAKATVEAAASTKQDPSGTVITLAHSKPWETEQFSAVTITLDTAEIDTEVDFKFTPFPRPQEMTPAHIVPSTLLSKCMERRPAGFFVANPKTLVILYDRTEGDAKTLTDAAERARIGIEDICQDVSTRYRVEKYLRTITLR